MSPEQKAEVLARHDARRASFASFDPVVAAPPPNPEDPTPAEVEQVSAMLDAANGTLGIVGAIATDTTTTAQEKVDLILQTLDITQ